MEASFAAARTGHRVLRREHDRQVVAWTAFAAGLGIAIMGAVGDSPALVGLGGAMVAGLGAILAPQLLLASFLVAGGLKAAPFLSGVPADLTILAAGGVLLAVALRALGPDGVPTLPPTTVLAVGLAALITISVLWTPDPGLGLEKALRFQLLTMLAFFAPLVLVRSRDELKRLMVFLVLASLVVALTAVPGETPGSPLTVAGGSSQIELALYASSGMVAAIGYLVLVPGSRWRILWLVPGAVLGQTVIEAGSRGVLIATVLALVYIGVLTVARARAKALPITIIVTGVALVTLFFAQIAGPATERYEALVGGEGPSTLGKRNFLIQDGIDLALNNPMGIGVAGYHAETGFPYPHNALVEVAAEQGVIGLGLLLALFVAAFRASRRAREGPLSPESILVGGLLIVLVLDSMVSQTFTQFRELWFALGLALAVPWIATRGPEEEPVAPRGPAAPSSARS